MKPIVKIAEARTPSGAEMALYRHDRDFTINIDGQDLMHSRQHESELELARLGCAHLTGYRSPCILIGGLGMGYTLRQTLDMISPQARVVVGELLGAVVEWNREFLGVLNNRPLEDERVHIETGDVVELISLSRGSYDAILLDIDNGPNALTDPRNRRLYGNEGIRACYRALRGKGCLAVWSAGTSKTFEQRLMLAGFHVRRFSVRAAKGGKSQSRVVWVASQDKHIMPPGGGEPRHPITEQARVRPERTVKKDSRRRPKAPY